MSSNPAPAATVLQARDIVFAHPATSGSDRFELRVPALEVRAGEVLALCGPSGSGKSTLLSILAGLLPPISGSVWFSTDNGPIDLYRCAPRQWRVLRRYFGFVHQDPREYLNERRDIGDIVADPLHIHALLGDPAPATSARERIADLLARVGITGPRTRRERRARAVAALCMVDLGGTQAERKPPSLSGGQRQRVAIARAVVASPRVVFLDEPTSALDVSVQASILELLQRLRRELTRTAYVLVTHDLPLARHIADRVTILDRGEIVELGEVDRVFEDPKSTIARTLLGMSRTELKAIEQ